MMDNDRMAKVKIGGVDYPLIFTTKATKEIAKRYGGLANLGETLMKNENFEMALDEVTWLIALLANQSILIHNLQNEEQKSLLSEEAVELLTTPLELADYKNAITEAMVNGTRRHVESEDTTADGEPLKNVIVE
ncbi:hypothetical protein [uncultured Acetobacterium sp.]|uniref:hypothetical protein n=1 Tax=uncultured Acetobacterium sp. TaxID=217139 RepID=UPI0025E975D8|nr:hypothetical protein [uncultured Acetobacterium sp.]